jgi:SAM-dependent methyltransferase
MDDIDLKQQVRQFYNRVGWQVVSDGMYQNASYEDLRPVSAAYIHRCHMRVARFLKPGGRYLLDAGSGPIQYPDYLVYSQGFTYRVCVDISMVALQEAHKRLGSKGLYVAADVANLPFKACAFEGLVSLHTLHHLTPRDHARGYQEFLRVLQGGCSGVVVNGWKDSWLMKRSLRLIQAMERRFNPARLAQPPDKNDKDQEPTGTYVSKYDPDWLKQTLDGKMAYEIRVWRSVSVRFLRAVIQPQLGGRFWLWLLFQLEELFPHFFGEKGAYPLVVIRKDERRSNP